MKIKRKKILIYGNTMRGRGSDEFSELWWLTTFPSYWPTSELGWLTTSPSYWPTSELWWLTTFPSYRPKSELGWLNTIPSYWPTSELGWLTTFPSYWPTSELWWLTTFLSLLTYVWAGVVDHPGWLVEPRLWFNILPLPKYWSKQTLVVVKLVMTHSHFF